MEAVSIIVPVYKVEKYLEKCVRSLMAQTLKDIEIILVEDGSPDNCDKICDLLAASDSRIKVIHKKNQGVSAARNDGLKIARGEYVIFCDSDDWMNQQACEELYNSAKRYDADICIGDVYLTYGEKKKIVNFYAESFVTDSSEDIRNMICADIFRAYCKNPPASGPAFGYGGPWNKLVRRKMLVDKKIMFDLSVKGVFDDIIYSAYILANAKRVAYVQFPVYFYRQLEGSITHSFKENVMEINDAIFHAWEDFFKKYDTDGIYEKPFYACIVRRMDEAMKLYFVNDKNPKSKRSLKKELKSAFSDEPYITAIRMVELNKLSKMQKILVLLCKCHATSFAWELYKLKK